MAWLINSMKPKVARQYRLLNTAEKIWQAAKSSYSHLRNDARLFELRLKVRTLKQGEMTVSDYFSEIDSLWQELDYYQDFQADCIGDTVKFQQMLENE